MSETLQVWLFAGAFALIGGSYVWQWKHREDCERKRLENNTALTKLDGEVKRVFEEIGRAHNEGMRHRLHRAEGRIKLMAQKLGMSVGDED